MIVLRPVRLPADEQATLGLDTSFVTDRIYRHVGFSLCGLDQTLYDPAGEAGQETGLYLSRPIT